MTDCNIFCAFLLIIVFILLFSCIELPVVSPLIHAVVKCMDLWLKDLKQFLDSFDGPPLNYIPGCFISTGQIGPPALKYASMLELSNTPFRYYFHIFSQALQNTYISLVIKYSKTC